MSSDPTEKTKDKTTKAQSHSVVAIALPTGELQAGIKALTNSTKP